MMLTQERADILTKYLDENESEREALLKLSPEEAAKKLADAGFDYSEKELLEYGNALKLAVSEGELTDAELENVAGGAVITVSVGVAIAWGIAGFAAGFACNFKW